jgi:Asp-tRNA(Asn)/Glu-tRNA(Gln) amidotransferase A subunit family amidase
MLSIVAGPDPLDPISLPESGVDYVALLEGASIRGLRVAFSPDLGNPPIEPAVAAGIARAAEVFEKDLGAEVEQVQIELPDPFEYFWRWWGLELILMLDGEDSPPIEDFPPQVLEELDRLRGRNAGDCARTHYVERAKIHHAFASVFLDHDLLLMPTTAMVAFPHPGPEGGPLEVGGKRSTYPVLENQRCTEAIAHAGYPAITIPCGFTDGLPIGLQIAGPHFADGAILHAAAAFEAAAPWAKARPPL